LKFGWLWAQVQNRQDLSFCPLLEDSTILAQNLTITDHKKVAVLFIELTEKNNLITNQLW